MFYQDYGFCLAETPSLGINGSMGPDSLLTRGIAGLDKTDKFWVNWLKQNQDDLLDVLDDLDDQSFDRMLEFLVNFMGWPSQRVQNFDPLFASIQHVIDDGADELGIPIFPPEIMAYFLSKWTGSKVTTDHPLVRDNQKWLQVYYDSEEDMASSADAKQLDILVRQLATGELKENLGDFQEIVDYYDSPDISEGPLTGDTAKLYQTVIDDEQYLFTTTDNMVAFMNNEGIIKVYSYDGDRLYKDEDLPKVKNYIIGGMRYSLPVTGRYELASILGNHLAELILGEDGISILNLP